MKFRAGPSAGGGCGMKLKKMFRPKTMNMSPSNERAMIVASFIQFFLWFFGLVETSGFIEHPLHSQSISRSHRTLRRARPARLLLKLHEACRASARENACPDSSRSEERRVGKEGRS